MKRNKASRYEITVNGVTVPVEVKKIRGNAQIERAKRIADRVTRKYRLKAVFQQ